ncbi:GntR family transcriptional regulator [Paenibacillus sp. HB172176]|uniref:GntR family transcriptional regulator n=1 Tax=Paenibacillus sp. HB172176 TaxID=2493690 RepID=UPI001439C62B|nr:GntR family transcriptional regulator [Paenibacillus sp. HB172176]
MFDDRSPIYQQIADGIKNDIVSGTLQEGDQVMSTNQYASFYRINPATAAKGFQLLTDEDILYKRRGIGMFVSEGAKEKLLSERREQFFEKVVDDMFMQAKQIGIPVQEIINRIHNLNKEEKE